MENNIKTIFKKLKLIPISTLDIDEKNFKVIRIAGNLKNLSTIFDQNNIYEEWRDIETPLSYTGKKEWYVKINKKDPRIPEIEELMTDRMIKEISTFNKKRARILEELRNHFEIKILENPTITFSLTITMFIYDKPLSIFGKHLEITLNEKILTINENQKINIPKISNEIKKDIIIQEIK